MQAEPKKPPIQCSNDVTFIKIVQEIVLKESGLFTIYALLLLTLPLKDIVFPKLVGSLYSTIQGGKGIQMIVIGIVAIIITLQVINIVSDYVELQLNPAMYKFIREKLMDHLFKIKETNYSDVDIGQIISKIVKLPSVMHHHIENIRSYLIPYAITALCILGYMLYLDWKLGLPLFGVICVFLATLYYSLGKCGPIAFKRDEVFSLMMSTTDDLLRNMITIMSFNKRDDEKEGLDEIHKLYAKHAIGTLNCTLYSKYINAPLILGFVIFVCYYSYTKMKAKKMSPGEFVTLLIMCFMVMNILFSTLDKWKDILLRNGIIENSLKSFEECYIARDPYTKPAENKIGLRFQDVRFSYITTDTERPVFDNFTLDINTKETTLIVGEIGSGKSTIISLLLKYQTPQGGEIFLEGVPYSNIPTADLRKRMVYIPQSPILLNRSVYDNVVYGITPPPSKEEVATLIRNMNLKRFLDNLPKGVDTSVGVHGNKLSGGQRQIVWILKAILMNPEIIVMDEPTAAVDDETKGIVHHLLEKVVQGKTVIMITHDPYLLKFANRIITMKDGEVVEDSAHPAGKKQKQTQERYRPYQ